MSSTSEILYFNKCLRIFPIFYCGRYIPVWYTPINHGHCIFIIYIYNSAGRKRTNQFSAGNLGNLGHFFQAYSISDMRKLGIIFPTFSTFPRFPSFQFTIFPFFKKKNFPEISHLLGIEKNLKLRNLRNFYFSSKSYWNLSDFISVHFSVVFKF